jgi:hypothetical protein
MNVFGYFLLTSKSALKYHPGPGTTEGDLKKKAFNETHDDFYAALRKGFWHSVVGWITHSLMRSAKACH